MRRLSLRLRLALAGAVAVALAIAAASLALAGLFAGHVERRAVAELSVQLDQVAAGLDHDAEGWLTLVSPPADPRFDQVYGGLYWQVDHEGAVLRSRSLWDHALPLPSDALADGALHVHDVAGPQGETLLAVERSVTLADRIGGGRARVTVATDRAEIDGARAGFLRDVLPYSALLAAALILAGWAQIAVGLRPLGEIGRRVAAVRAGAASRLGAEVPAELAPLASELDALLDAREADVARARQRAGDLAHGLKTPLQALLGEAARLRADWLAPAADSIEEIAGTMQRHVDRELARTRVALRAGTARAELAPVVAGVLRVVARTAAGRALDWIGEVPAGLPVAAEAGDLAEAIGALVENAARHARGVVRVTATATPTAVTLIIRDDGPGIPPDRIAALMERGAREDTRGTGLGLAIAAEVVEAIGGTLTLANADPGLEARMELPRAR